MRAWLPLRSSLANDTHACDMQYTDALAAADRAVLFKMTVKQTAHSFGIIPCFMAKVRKRAPDTRLHIDVDGRESMQLGQYSGTRTSREPVAISTKA